MRVTTVEEMRGLDHRAVAELAIPEEILMENAGLAVYGVIQRELGVVGRRFAVLAGPGNNGGDALVVARKLASEGGRVELAILGDPERFTGVAALNWRAAQAAAIPVSVAPDVSHLETMLADAEVVVDGLLGTGLTREVGGTMASAVAAVNRVDRPVVAVDVPSGIDGDSGAVRGVAVRATHTVTFGLPKRGLLLYPGFEHCGQLWVSHISFPRALLDDPGVRVALNEPPRLPARSPAGHKGSFGDALFVAGAAGYLGAPTFAARAHLRAGGGYARLAAPRSVTPALGTIACELVLIPQEETSGGSLALAAADGLLGLAAEVDSVVVGPGLSIAEETQRLVRRLTAEVPVPLVIDGDGLTAVAGDPGAVRRRTAPTVLTPHPGEMARLAGLSTGEVLADPVAVVQRVAADLGAIVVLKGAHSLVGHPNGRVFINLTGNSGLATAGSGDVLTGTVTAMSGLGLAVPDAVATAVLVHGLAGDLAAAQLGEDGVTAPAVLNHLPAAVATYRKDYCSLVGGFAGVVRHA